MKNDCGSFPLCTLATSSNHQFIEQSIETYEINVLLHFINAFLLILLMYDIEEIIRQL